MKCCYCGSTAQPKLISKTETDARITYVYVCGCGAKVERYLKRTLDVVWSPTGTRLICNKYE